LGEGWHNYHHVFPYDYRTSELGRPLNPSTAVIDAFARVGWAYDLKAVPASLVKRRMERTGDATPHPEIWGWGDKEMPKEEQLLVYLTACEN
jgi:stearoyl-CoA desaturase (Delta-9 desaturase)